MNIYDNFFIFESIMKILPKREDIKLNTHPLKDIITLFEGSIPKNLENFLLKIDFSESISLHIPKKVLINTEYTESSYINEYGLYPTIPISKEKFHIIHSIYNDDDFIRMKEEHDAPFPNDERLLIYHASALQKMKVFPFIDMGGADAVCFGYEKNNIGKIYFGNIYSDENLVLLCNSIEELFNSIQLEMSIIGYELVKR